MDKPKGAWLFRCTICGKELEDGDPAYATTTGTIQEEMDGFMPDENPYPTVACEECGYLISDAIDKLVGEKWRRHDRTPDRA